MRDDVTDFFGRPETIAALLASHERDDAEVDGVHNAVRLAWYLRQKDTLGSIELLRGMRHLLERPIEQGCQDDLSVAGRALLIEAEIVRLQGEFDAFIVLLRQARALFDRAGDAIGLGDCAMLDADDHIGRGEVDHGRLLLSEAVEAFDRGGDEVRLNIARARLASEEEYINVADTAERWSSLLSLNPATLHPAAQAQVCLYRGNVDFKRGDFPQSIREWESAFDTAMQVGAVRLAIHLAMVTGASYANLFDLPTALEWKERAFALAKGTGWPEAMGSTLSSMAETTTSLGQYERALALFEEAIPYLRRLPGTRRHFIAYMAFGNLYRALGDWPNALAWYQEAEVIAGRVGHLDMIPVHSAALASALLGLGRLEEAETAALRLRHADRPRGNPYYAMESLRVLAGIQRARDGHAHQAIPLLQEAVKLGESLDGMNLRSDLYDELARLYEASGDFHQALIYERKARDSWQRNFDKQNGARILAMQVRFDTARARADAEHHRNLAQAEAARAAELDRANQVLEKMGSIGQEITARLDSEAVFTTLSQHLQDMIHVSTLFLGLKDETLGAINILYRMEDGRRLPPRQVPLASDTLSARCVRDNDEILVSWGEPTNPTTLPGTRHMRTVLYRPLSMGDRVLGVVSVQSDRSNAYGPRELLIFRTICAYGAIAMANAAAYQQVDRAVEELREALQRLVQQEKMAALGQLVAGVAHEVNTPLGVTLSAVSQLNDNIRLMSEQMAKGALTRTVLSEHLESGQELAMLAQRNVVRAADMVRAFKGVAVDQGSDERRQFELGDYIKEVISLMRGRIAANGNKVQLDIATIHMDTYPGALAQAISNLLANVADHAYEPGVPGIVTIVARRLDSRLVEITVTDQGCGIAPDILPKVFDPFFTTRRASGSMGLGLHVAFNQVTQRLNGTIVIDSVPGQGTVATLRIPCEVPGVSAGLPPSAR